MIYKRNSIRVLLCVLAFVCIWALYGIAFADPILPPMDLTKATPSAGNMNRGSSEVSIAGKLFQGYVGHSTVGGWSIWRVPKGYTTFTAFVGVEDRGDQNGSAVFEVSIDGDVVKSIRLSKGDKAEKLIIPVKAGSSLRLQYNVSGLALAVFAEPQLLAQTPDKAKPAGDSTAPSGGSQNSPFVVASQ